MIFTQYSYAKENSIENSSRLNDLKLLADPKIYSDDGTNSLIKYFQQNEKTYMLFAKIQNNSILKINLREVETTTEIYYFEGDYNTLLEKSDNWRYLKDINSVFQKILVKEIPNDHFTINFESYFALIKFKILILEDSYELILPLKKDASTQTDENEENSSAKEIQLLRQSFNFQMEIIKEKLDKQAKILQEYEKVTKSLIEKNSFKTLFSKFANINYASETTDTNWYNQITFSLDEINDTFYLEIEESREVNFKFSLDCDYLQLFSYVMTGVIKLTNAEDSTKNQFFNIFTFNFRSILYQTGNQRIRINKLDQAVFEERSIFVNKGKYKGNFIFRGMQEVYDKVNYWNLISPSTMFMPRCHKLVLKAN